MLRRNAFDAGMIWDETLRIEDWDLFLRLVARDALAFMDVTVCAYRLHGENVSKTRETNKRLSNLGEFGVVAERSAAMFNDSEYWLLRAQSSLITAKIAFLKKKYFKVLTHVSIYCARSMMALRKPGGGVFR